MADEEYNPNQRNKRVRNRRREPEPEPESEYVEEEESFESYEVAGESYNGENESDEGEEEGEGEEEEELEPRYIETYAEWWARLESLLKPKKKIKIRKKPVDRVVKPDFTPKKPKPKPKPVVVVIPSSDDESSPYGSDDDSFKVPEAPLILLEFMDLLRTVQFVPYGTPLSTTAMLLLVYKYDLTIRLCQWACLKVNGMRTFLNIISIDFGTNMVMAKTACYLIVRELTQNRKCCREFMKMKGIELMVLTVRKIPAKDLQFFALQTLFNIVQIQRGRRKFRKMGGLQLLLDKLDLEVDKDLVTFVSREDNFKLDLEYLHECVIILYEMCQYRTNSVLMLDMGSIPVLVGLMATQLTTLTVPTVRILNECVVTDSRFVTALRLEGMLPHLVEGLRHQEAQDYVEYCCVTIFWCAHETESRDEIYELGATEPLIQILRNGEFRQNKKLFEAATGAIWKCGAAIGAAKTYVEDGLIDLLSDLFVKQHGEIMGHICGAFEQILTGDPETATLIRKCNLIPRVLGLLIDPNTTLLTNGAKLLGLLSFDKDCKKDLDDNDAFRLVWSLMRNPNPEVQAATAWAICHFVENSGDTHEVILSVGIGLQVMMELLHKTRDHDVVAGLAQAVAEIARTKANLAIMSDHGVCYSLSLHADTESDILRLHISNAITECCTYKDNPAEFGRCLAVSPVCTYLHSKDPVVHLATLKALVALTPEGKNLVTMHQSGILPYLIKFIMLEDDDEREVLAKLSIAIMEPIRKLAMDTAYIRLL